MRTFLVALCATLVFATAAAAGTSTSRPAASGAADQATLTVSMTGPGMGWVTSDPAGIRCGSVCSAQFAVGTTLKLFRIVAPGSTFAGISEPCKAVGNKEVGYAYCTVTLLGDTSVQATFNIAPPVPPPPKPCSVPKVRGMDLWSARYTLKQAGCRPGTIRHVFSRKVENGTVISQNPRHGWQREHNARVDLVVSKGRRHAH
jgi:hypothetical protein